MDNYNKMSFPEIRQYNKFQQPNKEYLKLYLLKQKAYQEQITKEYQDRAQKKYRIERGNNSNVSTIINSESSTENLMMEGDHEDIGNNMKVPSAIPDSTMHQLSLDNFFKRPILLDTFAVEENTMLDRRIFPYQAWTDDPQVRAKLRNYAFFKGDLKLRISCTSSKFAFGTLAFGNVPYASFNPTTQFLRDPSFPMGNSLYNLAFVSHLLQSPEHHLLHFGQDNDFVMSIPFLMPKPTSRLFNRDSLVIDNNVVFSEMKGISTIFIRTLNRLQFQGTVIDSDVRIHVHAWCDNVELGPLTGTPITVLAESSLDNLSETYDKTRDAVNSNKFLNKVGDFAQEYAGDEYQDAGPASTIASAVANVTSKFSSIPVLGEFAKATSLVAGKSAKVLKWFGFSRPVNIDPLSMFKGLGFSNGAYVENKDTAYKLTMDPKQELSLKSFGGNSDIDSMAIKVFTSRESLFFTRSVGAAEFPNPLLDNLCVIPISPDINIHYIQDTQSIRYPSGMSFAARCFRYWRGTINYRFEFVTSSFTRGKVAFIYEPNGSNATVLDSIRTDLNAQYIYIMDLETTRDITISVGFLYDKLFCKVDSSNRELFSQPVIGSPSHEFINVTNNLIGDQYRNGANTGFIYARYLNVPNQTAIVEMNAYTWSDDMEFSVPRDPTFPNDFSRSFVNGLTRSKVTSESGIDVDNSSSVTQMGDNYRKICTNFLINKTPTSQDNVLLYHFGERVESFRSLLKRDDITLKLEFTADSTSPYFILELPIYPCPSFRSQPNTLSSINANLGGQTSSSFDPPLSGNVSGLFNYLRYAYFGMKGGYRHRLTFSNNLNYEGNVYVNSSDRINIDRYTTELLTTVSTFVGPNTHGGLIFREIAGGGIEFEIPYFSENLYDLAFKTLSFADGETDTDENVFAKEFRSAIVSHETARADDIWDVSDITAAAEDFTFFRFQSTVPFII